jgi:hypothetical protein
MRLEHKEWEVKWQNFMLQLIFGRVLYSIPEIAHVVETHACETQPGKNPGNNKNRRS